MSIFYRVSAFKICTPEILNTNLINLFKDVFIKRQMAEPIGPIFFKKWQGKFEDGGVFKSVDLQINVF